MADEGPANLPAIAVIEVRGMLNAATIVDAMFKAADVEMQRSLRVGSGWIAIWIGGELNAVNTATDAAYQALETSSEARSCVFTLPSDAIRQFMMTPVSA